MANKDLVKFIKECRKRGFEDYQAREHMLAKGWPSDEIELAFECLKSKSGHKKQVIVYLEPRVLHKIGLRAKRNMFSVPEQIEDILRRSILSLGKRTAKEEKVDDKFITFFSRKAKKK